MISPSVEAEDGGAVIFGHTVSDLQTDIEIEGNAITGTLKYVDTGALATDWGAGNFMVLKFTNNDPDVIQIKVGLTPSEGSGLVPLDEDMNGVFKVTDKDTQKFTVQYTDGSNRTETKYYDLSDLVTLSE